ALVNSGGGSYQGESVISSYLALLKKCQSILALPRQVLGPPQGLTLSQRPVGLLPKRQSLYAFKTNET
ncbi:TPA: hypothetical protein DEB72_03115, partial [Patescibacteria group bacterium]|nr:hypothetical protein [Patescibacteria group bacterium]